MDEHVGVQWPQQQSQYRELFVKKSKSDVKQEKKMSKTENRFKSKLESLKKFQHSASTNGAVEKARAFFRSLELKHIGSSSDHLLSSRRSPTTTTKSNINNSIGLTPSATLPLPSSITPSSSSSIIDDSHYTLSTTTNDSLSKLKYPSNGTETARVVRIINPTYINPKDLIVHQAFNEEQGNRQILSTYFHNPHILSQKQIQPPKQYYNERSQSYTIPYDKNRSMQAKYDASQQFSYKSPVNSNIKYSSNIYSNYPPPFNGNINNRNIAVNPMSTSLYNYRPLVCRQMESSSLMSSSFHEQSHNSFDSMIRPLPSSASSSSMSTWTQSVRRLNTEYASTISALQQAKESFKQSYPTQTDKISEYANIVARGISDLSNNDKKQSSGTTFCLTALKSQESHSSSPNMSKVTLSQERNSQSPMFTKPKLVRPVELGTFVSSASKIPKLESTPTVIKNNEKSDSIANIIKKFNNINNPSSNLDPSTKKENNNDSLPSEIKKEQRENFPKSILYDSTQCKKDYQSVSVSRAGTDINPSLLPHVQFKPSITTYELEDIPYESPVSSSEGASSASQDSTSSTSTSPCNENQFNENDTSDINLQEETTYTVETFYKTPNGLQSSNQEVVIIRENTTEEQFNLAREKNYDNSTVNHQTPSQHTYTINESKISPLTTPLRTNLNITVKQKIPTSSVIEQQEEIHENYHIGEPLSKFTKNLISTNYRNDEDNVKKNDVVTINPHAHSPGSYCLISSTSSSSSGTSSSSASSTTSYTTSSASTVLLTNNKITAPTVSSSVTTTSGHTNINLAKNNNNNNKTASQLPKPIATTSTNSNISRLKQPSKIASVPSKLKPPSATVTTKPVKPIIVNSVSNITATTTTPTMQKSTGTANQSSSITNNMVNKITPEQPSSSSLSSSSILISGKKQQLVNGTNMTESQNPTDSIQLDPSLSIGKSRVRSMVNQFNAAVTSSRPTVPSTTSTKRVPVPSVPINTRRSAPNELAVNPTISINKTTAIPTTRSPLQRAMTINNSPTILSPSPSTTPQTPNNNVASNYKRKTPLVRSTSNVKEGLLRWCQAQVVGYSNVSVTNLSSSWADGLAFCALTHHFFPDAFDFNTLSSANRKENFELAFRIAEERAGVPRLLDVSDMLIMGNRPDDKCIFTYLNSFLAKVKDIHPSTNRIGHN